MRYQRLSRIKTRSDKASVSSAVGREKKRMKEKVEEVQDISITDNTSKTRSLLSTGPQLLSLEVHLASAGLQR